MNLQKKFQEPKGFTWGQFKNAKGFDIRYGHIAPKGDAKATIVLGPGYGEPVEKFFETIKDLVDQGYAVWAMDWCGQGGSERTNTKNLNKPYFAEKFIDHHVDDLNQFTTQIVQKSGDKKLEGQKTFFMGFSMGGHIGLRYLKKHPDTFDAALLNAAMLDFNTGAIPRNGASLLAWFMNAANKLDDYIPNGHDWSAEKRVFKNNVLTSDPERFNVQISWFEEKPELQLGSQTYGWFYHADKSVQKLRMKDYLEGVETPILMSVPTNDLVVLAQAQIDASDRMKNSSYYKIDGSGHEIAMEQNKYRDLWWKKTTGFLTEQLKKKPVMAPKKSNSLPKPKR